MILADRWVLEDCFGEGGGGVVEIVVKQGACAGLSGSYGHATELL